MGFLGALAGDILEPRSPVQNPLFGAQQGPDGVWRDVNGQIISNGGKPITPQLVAQPYSNPSFGQRLLTPDIANYQNEANGAFYQRPLIAGQQRTIAENQLYQPNATNLQNAGYGNANQWYSMTGGSPQNQGDINRTAIDSGAFGTGLLGQVGATGTQGDLTEQQNRAIQARTSQDVGIPTMQPTAEAGGLSYDIGLNPYRQASVPAVGSTIENQALIGQGQSAQTVSDLPTLTGTQHLQTIGENYRSGFMPDEMTTLPYVSTVGAGGVTPSGGQINPSFRPAMIANMAALQRGLVNGQPAGQTGTLSSGKGFTYNPPPAAVQPMVGTAYQGTGQGVSQTTTPVDKYPGYSVDFSTGRVYQDGQDVTSRANPTIIQSAIEQLHQQHGDAQDAAHDAHQATIASQIAALQAQKKQLAAHHIRSGLIPQVLAGGEAYAKQGYQGLVNADERLTTPVRNYLRQKGSEVYNGLIGQ
jgi:hypothetical protein